MPWGFYDAFGLKHQGKFLNHRGLPMRSRRTNGFSEGKRGWETVGVGLYSTIGCQAWPGAFLVITAGLEEQWGGFNPHLHFPTTLLFDDLPWPAVHARASFFVVLWLSGIPVGEREGALGSVRLFSMVIAHFKSILTGMIIVSYGLDRQDSSREYNAALISLGVVTSGSILSIILTACPWSLPHYQT